MTLAPRLTPILRRPAKSKYPAISVNGAKIDEHRHIMQAHLGRKLRPDETVHHINEDKYDRRLENLEVKSLEEHGRMHAIKILTESEVLAIRASSLSHRNLATLHRVSKRTIFDVKHRRSWRHI